MRLALTTMLMFAASCSLASLLAENFVPADADAVQQVWSPQFGSLPARFEKDADGQGFVALDARYAKQGDRACWDWSGTLDLSKAGRMILEMSSVGEGSEGLIGMYFGTPTGWYARFHTWGGPRAWTRIIHRLDTWGIEGEPGGWDKVDRFRFSVWSSHPGEATYRLRRLEFVEDDPGENFVKNGSFEVPGVGVPYAWGSGHWGVGSLPWAADMDLWRNRWKLDATTAKHGNASLLIDNQEGLERLRACSVWLYPPSRAKELVVSAWLKSDAEALPVTLHCGDKSVPVQVGRDWTQAVLGGLKPAELMTITIVPESTGRLWLDAVQMQVGSSATTDFHPAYADEEFMAREADIDWTPPQRTADVAAGRSVSGPTQPASVTIDAEGRVLLDGKPYIQHSLGLEFVSDLAILDFAAQSGFSDVCCQIRESLTTEQLKAIFDRCAQVGLRIIPWLDGRISDGRFREHIVALRDHPALLCWYVYDEPSGDRFAVADARYRLAKELDPNHPALINYLPDKLTDHTGDIYSTDVYPIPHSTPGSAVGAVRAMKQSAGKRPVWMWLQGTGYAYWMDREPSPRELSCMVYGSLIEGANGIYYFAQIPRTRECWNEMRAMCVEVAALTPAICSTEPAPTVSCDDADILCRAYAHQGKLWVLAVNTAATTRQVQFTSGNVNGSLQVEFEGRQVEALEGKWRDSFGAYERRVYRTE